MKFEQICLRKCGGPTKGFGMADVRDGESTLPHPISKFKNFRKLKDHAGCLEDWHLYGEVKIMVTESDLKNFIYKTYRELK